MLIDLRPESLYERKTMCFGVVSTDKTPRLARDISPLNARHRCDRCEPSAPAFALFRFFHSASLNTFTMF